MSDYFFHSLSEIIKKKRREEFNIVKSVDSSMKYGLVVFVRSVCRQSTLRRDVIELSCRV
jgi:hypothetical protein